MIRTIAFVGQKGGTGKTSLAISIGVAAMEAGAKPYLIDLDPQASLIAWGERRQADAPAVDRISPDRLAAAVAGLDAAGFDLAIVDTAGLDHAAVAAAMKIADLCLIPARPSVLDLEATRPTLTTLAQLDRAYSFILNCCPPGRTERVGDATRALALLGVLALPPIVQRIDHVDAIGLGLGVTEHDPEGKAASEIRALWRWIDHRIGRSLHGEAETTAVS